MNVAQLASTFNGKVDLIPDILIDDFTQLHKSGNLNIKYCFISHAHSDHYKGLNDSFPTSPQILCTRATHILIKEQNRGSLSISRNMFNCTECEFNRPIQLEPSLQATLLPNFHCLGSAMILITDTRGDTEINVLFTGDAKFEDSTIQSFKQHKALMPFIYGPKIIDMLYLDTTFAYRNTNISMLENMHGIHQLVEVIQMYPKGTRFRFLDTVYGFEEVWAKVNEWFPGSTWNLGNSGKWILKVKETVNDRLECNTNCVDTIHELSNKVVDDPQFTFIIGKKTDAGSERCVNLKHAIDLTRDEYENFHLPKKRDEFVSLVEVYDGVFEGRFEYHGEMMVFQYYKHNEVYLPRHMKFMYSRHSSYSETKQFVDLFKEKPRDLYPITESKVTWHHGFNISKFYGVVDNSYDVFAQSLYGPCNVDVHSDVANTEVADYWSSAKSFNSVSTECDFDFEPIGLGGKRLDDRKDSFIERKVELRKYTGEVIKTQITEKKNRRHRFNENLDVVHDNDSNVEIINIDSDRLDTGKGGKKRKVMKVSSNLNTLIDNLDFV